MRELVKYPYHTQIKTLDENLAVKYAIGTFGYYEELEKEFTALRQRQQELLETIDSQKQTHDALLKKCADYEGKLGAMAINADTDAELISELVQLAQAVYITSECKDGSHQDALKNLYDYFIKKDKASGENGLRNDDELIHAYLNALKESV